jgi:hypothetical protein
MKGYPFVCISIHKKIGALITHQSVWMKNLSYLSRGLPPLNVREGGEGIINLGNINDASFSDIIEGERANNLVDGFSRREAVEELCRKCGYRKRFGK